MNRADVLREIRKMRFLEVYERCQMRRLSYSEAAETLGVSERTFRRMRGRFEAEGEDGLVDRRVGKPSAHRISVTEADRIAALYRDRYLGWTVKHFHERCQERHELTAGYGWTKSVLHAAGLVRPAAKRSAHRKKRPRRPLPGMLLHQDGSRYLWLPALERQIDLIVTMDDATSAIYSMFLVEEEGTASSFRGLIEVIERHGLFCSLYTDRGSHYFHTPKAGAKVAKEQPTQVGRALAQLGIRHIPAYSPGSARALRAHVWHAPEPAGQGTGRRRYPHHRGRQSLHRGDLPDGTQPAFCHRRQRAGERLRALDRRFIARDPLPPRGPRRR
jgi:transposase